MVTKKFYIAILAVLLLAGIRVTLAANYPSKPIRMIVAWGPGGAPDIFARLIGQKLHEQMGQPVIVDNRPGATGNIGAEIVSKANNDGHTLFNATLSLAISPAFYKKLPFDPIKSFAPVAMLASVPLVLVVHPGLPASSVTDFITYAKANPAKLNYASVGNGSPAHMSAVLFQNISGIKIVHIPYKSGGAMATAILTNEAQIGFPAIAPALPHIKANRLRAVAVTARRRSGALPETPTFAEGGLAGIEADNWNGIMAPAGTPKAIIVKLETEISNALRAPGVAEQFVRQGADANYKPAAEFALEMKAEVAKWEKVVKTSGIEPQ